MSLALQSFSLLPTGVQRLIVLNLEGDEVVELCKNSNKGACFKDDYLWKELMMRDYKLRDGTKREYLSYKNLEKWVDETKFYLTIGAYEKYLENSYWSNVVGNFIDFSRESYPAIQAKLGHVIDNLLDNISDINLLDKDGYSLLFDLVPNIDINNLNKLLDKGADVNIIVNDYEGNTMTIWDLMDINNIDVFERVLEYVNEETLNHIYKRSDGDETFYGLALFREAFEPEYAKIIPLLRARGAKTYAELQAEGRA